MNFVFHSSDLFSAVLVVSMVSIMENNKNEDTLIFYIIEHGITNEHQQKFKDLVGKYPNSKVVFIPMPNINEKFGLGLKQIKSIWLFDSYCRLFLGTLLPDDVDRVLYLDCDTLCTGSLHNYFQN